MDHFWADIFQMKNSLFFSDEIGEFVCLFCVEYFQTFWKFHTKKMFFLENFVIFLCWTCFFFRSLSRNIHATKMVHVYKSKHLREISIYIWIHMYKYQRCVLQPMHPVPPRHFFEENHRLHSNDRPFQKRLSLQRTTQLVVMWFQGWNLVVVWRLLAVFFLWNKLVVRSGGCPWWILAIPTIIEVVLPLRLCWCPRSQCLT